MSGSDVTPTLTAKKRLRKRERAVLATLNPQARRLHVAAVARSILDGNPLISSSDVLALMHREGVTSEAVTDLYRAGLWRPVDGAVAINALVGG